MGVDVQGHLGLLTQEASSQEMADGRRLLEAVTGESACAPEAIQVVDWAQYGLMIGRHFV